MSIYYTLHVLYCILYNIHMLRFISQILHTMYCRLHIQCYVLDTSYYMMCIIYSSLYTLLYHSKCFSIFGSACNLRIQWEELGSGGRGRARWTQASYGQPTASRECEQYQTTRKPTKTKIWSSGSPAMFSIVAQIFGFFLFFSWFSEWFCSTLGQPLWFVLFFWFYQWFSRV